MLDKAVELSVSLQSNSCVNNESTFSRLVNEQVGILKSKTI